jgi:hypothetical protein
VPIHSVDLGATIQERQRNRLTPILARKQQRRLPAPILPINRIDLGATIQERQRSRLMPPLAST